MNWNEYTVPQHVEERHELSVMIGLAFAKSYAIHPHSEETVNLLEIYKESRRMVNRHGNNAYQSRYGSLDAYNATQGYGKVNY